MGQLLGLIRMVRRLVFRKKIGVCYKAAVSILLPIFSDGFGISTCANVLEKYQYHI